MEVERALLDGEQEAELAQLQSDKDMLEQLNGKMGKMEKSAPNNQTRVNTGGCVADEYLQVIKASR